MSLFQLPSDEENVCGILRAYVEEWGAENVLVSVPILWKPICPLRLGKAQVIFNTGNSIRILVVYQSVRLKYELQLNDLYY
jgi:hypothetical protein